MLNAIRRWWKSRSGQVSFGRRGEQLAARYLQRRGYKILGRNVLLPIGEIDLIARHGETIVFVEVKTRQTDGDGHPSEFVDERKQRKLTNLALYYLKSRGWMDRPARFDIIAVTWDEASGEPVIDHIEHAFEAVGGEGMYS